MYKVEVKTYAGIMTYPFVLALLLAFSGETTAPFSPNDSCEPMLCATVEKHDLLLYYTTYCPYSQRVLKYLKKIHKQLPMKNLADDPLAKKELKSVGGKMQVPCLVIDGKALYESNEIIRWLSQHQEQLSDCEYTQVNSRIGHKKTFFIKD